VEHTGDDHGYFLSTLKLGVRLNWYLHSIRRETDVILEIMRETSPLVTDVDVMSALRAGYDQVCHSRAVGGGMYNRFVVFNMTQYESVLYLDSDIIPVNDISDLIANGTHELRRAGRYLMWAHERRYDWFNAGVMLVRPQSDVFAKLMRLYVEQVDSGLVRVIDSYSGISGTLKMELFPYMNQKDQAILNHVFHPHKNMSLSMSDAYNALLYEHTDTSDAVLRYAYLIHLIHTKTWKSPWCHLKYNHGKICNMWWATPTVLV
jgi:alpha-N-acetylglucosamine transferase